MEIEHVRELADEVNFSCILPYESHGNTYYIDQRTQLIDGIHHVLPVGKAGDYYHVCCPDCGQFEVFHKSNIWKNHKVKARCKNRQKRSRVFLVHNKETDMTKLAKVPVQSYIIDLEGWDKK